MYTIRLHIKWQTCFLTMYYVIIFKISINRYPVDGEYTGTSRIMIKKSPSPCAVESCPTPGDNRGSTSPFGSLSGVPSHAVNGRSF